MFIESMKISKTIKIRQKVIGFVVLKDENSWDGSHGGVDSVFLFIMEL